MNTNENKKTTITEDEIICADCGAIIEDGNYHELPNGDYICDDCYEDNYFTCEDCGEIVNRDYMCEVDDGKWVCECCRDDNYTQCDDCGGWYSNTDYYRGVGDLCDDCASHYAECQDCGNYFREDEMCSDDYGDLYCEDCYANHHKYGLHEYHWGRDTGWYSKPIFATSENRHAFTFGVELEMDCGDFDYDKMGDGDNLYHFEEDGSLSEDGVEMITQPCSLKYHENHFPWERLLESAMDCGFKSHDTDDCGLHFHIGRDRLRKSDILKMDLFINRCSYFWEKIARRNCSHYAEMDRYKSVHDCVRNSESRSYERYQAVNTTNPDTVEIRIARGTLNKETIFGTMELYQAMIYYLRGVSVMRLVFHSAEVLDGFMRWLAVNSKEYKNAIAICDRLANNPIAHEINEKIKLNNSKKGERICA